MQLNPYYNQLPYVYSNYLHNQVPNGLIPQFTPVVRFHNGTASPISLQGRANVIAPPLSPQKHTFRDGSCFFGRYINQKREGYGKNICADRTVSEGYWIQDQMNGYGKVTFPDGSRYEGNWVNGKKDGYGIFVFASGEYYMGNWKNDHHHGRGKYVHADGTYYDGAWLNHMKHGFGTATFPDNGFYEGQWAKGQIHGNGKYQFPNGSTYEGQWVNEKQDGHGTYHFAGGAIYVGDWKQGKKEGHGTYVYYEAGYVGNWVNDQPTDTSSSNLTDLGFLNPLLGFDMMPIVTYHLGIVASFLNQTSDSYKAIAAELIRAQQFEKAPEEGAQSAFEILNDAQIPPTGKSVLIHSGFAKHAVGVNFVQDCQTPESVFVDVYNSGLGLATYHQRLGKKYQTRFRVEIPLNRITLDVLSRLLRSDFQTINELYTLLIDLSDNHVVTPPEDTAIYQTQQKHNNCALEWIFVVLRHLLGNKYNEMRLTLFKTCLERIHQVAPKWPKHKLMRIVNELQRKIAKRQKKLEDSNIDQPKPTK